MSVFTKMRSFYVSWELCLSLQWLCTHVAMLACVYFYVNGQDKCNGWWCDWVRQLPKAGVGVLHCTEEQQFLWKQMCRSLRREGHASVASTGGEHLPCCILRVLVLLHIAQMCCVKRLIVFHSVVYRFCSNIRPLDWRGHQAAALPSGCAR